MFRANRAPSPVDVAWRLLAPLLILALVLSAEAVVPAVVEAGSSGNVAAIRQRQTSAEAAMRRADKQIDRLQKQRRQHAKLLKVAKRKLDRTIGRRDAVRRKADRRNDRLDELRLVLARGVRVHPNPKGAQVVDKPALRKRIHRLEKKAARSERKLRKAIRKVDAARERKQQRATKVGSARIAARKAERERSEDKLGSNITQMLALSRSRARSTFATASAKRFSKPVKGTISQNYGCTGYRLNPRRGSCRHFHDGVDIVAKRGTRVRASADGYIAFVGYNPWDTGKRAFVVIIGHASGYQTVYAHLKPVRKVSAGQRVERGHVIGLVGMTGRSTGPHVHWEVRKGSAAVNPLRAGR